MIHDLFTLIFVLLLFSLFFDFFLLKYHQKGFNKHFNLVGHPVLYIN